MSVRAAQWGSTVQVLRQAPGHAAGLRGSAEGAQGLHRAVPPGHEPAFRRPRREAEGRGLQTVYPCGGRDLSPNRRLSATRMP